MTSLVTRQAEQASRLPEDMSPIQQVGGPFQSYKALLGPPRLASNNNEWWNVGAFVAAPIVIMRTDTTVFETHVPGTGQAF